MTQAARQAAAAKGACAPPMFASGQYLVLGAKARAAMDGRSVPDLDDVKAIAPVVLGHRMVMNFQAEAEGAASLEKAAEAEGAEATTSQL